MEDNYKKLHTIYFPRLEEITKQQELVIQEVEKMKESVQYFPTMFRAEKHDRFKVQDTNKQLNEQIEDLALTLGNMRMNYHNAKKEVLQKEAITLEVFLIR